MPTIDPQYADIEGLYLRFRAIMLRIHANHQILNDKFLTRKRKKTDNK